MNSIKSTINANMSKLRRHPGFAAWLKSQSLAKDDIIVVNNSFVYRDVKTVKSDKYLAFRALRKKALRKTHEVATWGRVNADFKLIRFSSKNLPSLQSLDSAIEEQLESLGYLVFVLLGEVEDTIILEQELRHSGFDVLIWDPMLPESFRIEGSKILIKEAYDEDIVITWINAAYRDREEDVPDGLRESVVMAIDRLQDRAVASLRIPIVSEPSRSTMTSAIVEVLQEQKANYLEALAVCDGDPAKDPHAYNEILRISYNFASDASKFLRLIVCICDLKPVVLWGTIAEHFGLSENFRKLPWARSRRKPSLGNYITTIGDARNSAFHDLFPFRKSLDVSIPDNAFQNVSLRLFSEYSRKQENQLIYEDRELVDVLVEFTRARDRRAPSRFWHLNAKVMDSTIRLFKSTGDFLKIIFEETGL